MLLGKRSAKDPAHGMLEGLEERTLVNLCPIQDEKFAPNTRLPSAPCQLSVVRCLEKNPEFCYCMKLKYMLQTSTEVKVFAYHIGHLLSREGT